MPERIRTKSELKRLFTNLRRKLITDNMMSILIDLCYNEYTNMRTSGFDYPGGTDAVMSFDEPTRTLTIAPFDPVIEGWTPRFGIYTWAQHATYRRMYETYELELPDEEGLFCIYFDKEPDPGNNQALTYLKNPTEEQIETVYTEKVIVTFIYWDAANNVALHVGDDRHGSEWNPQIHWYLHTSQGAQRKSGLTFTGYSLNGDGSSNAHAQFNIVGGVMYHDDFELNIPTSSNSIPVLYSFGTTPRFLANNGYAFAGSSRVYFNSGQISLAQADSGNFVLYHIFATNEILTSSRKIISVMGTAQYTTLADAYKGVEPELDGIYSYMPQQGRCYLGSIIVQTADEYTNDVKARIVALTGNESHPPVSIAPGSENYLAINENQELAINMATPPDGLVSGGIVTWLTGLSYAVSMAVYYIGGRLYISPSTIITLDAADATNPRIDVIAVNDSGEVEIITGTPAAEPQKPTVDPATQIELTFVYLPANATEPEGITDEIIFDENVEWTPSAYLVAANFDSGVSPYSGAKCASIGPIGTNDYIKFTAAAPVAREDFEKISLFLKLKAVATSAHYLYVRFKLGANFVSNERVLPWARTDITNWQSIALPLTDFTFSNSQFDAVQLRWVKTGAQADHAGFYLDYVKLQRGVVPTVFADTVELTDDVLATGKTGTPIATTLKVVNSNVGSFGSATKSVTITVDAKGRITAVTENNIEGAGEPGADGREVELSTDSGFIVWRYVGDVAWTNLCPIPANGTDGADGAPGAAGAPGADGADGADGRGITSIVLFSTVGLVKTYRITFTDATTFDFAVTDGEDGTGGGGGVLEEVVEVYVDFENDGVPFTYTCPFALRFVSLEYEGSAPTLSVALNTDMAKYDDITITPNGAGLVILRGYIGSYFNFDVYVDFMIAGEETYKCPYALKFTSIEHEQANAPALDVVLDTAMSQYDVLTITADAPGLVTLKATLL